MLEIGRQDVPRRASLFAWVKPKRPVPPERIFEVGGRIGPDGRELQPLDETAVRAAAREIAAQGIGSVAVVLLHSYGNPAHERRVAAILAAAMPGALVSISSEVLPVFREYERSMTTILNASVMPVVAAYVARLDARIAEQGIAAPLLLMKSSGGVTSTRTVRRAPVETALSGPAACRRRRLRRRQLRAQEPDRHRHRRHLGRHFPDPRRRARPHHYRPRRQLADRPADDRHRHHRGGGRLDRARLGHGRADRGAAERGRGAGPVCYGRGGVEPTVTDAHLALGHLPPYLLGGSFRLDANAARNAIKMRIAEPLGMSVEAAARGILAIVDSNMVGAIRVVSVERGHDPRDFSLLPFGGAGPLHGGALARLLGMRTIVVPPGPGVLSALGLLVSNLKAEFTRTCLQKAGAFDAGIVARVFGELDAEARAWLDAEDVPAEARRIAWHASLRYQHQGFELFVPWADRDVTEASAAATIAAFHRLHERLYTFAQEDTPVEIVTLRVDARGVFPAPALRELPPAGSLEAARVGTQTVYLEAGPAEAAIYARERLGAGARIHGPAILTQLDATTLLLPGQVGTVDRFGNLIVEEASSE